jgi:hypothetical protein
MMVITECEEGEHFAEKRLACKPQISEFLAATMAPTKVPRATPTMPA